jgi:hypothetical protein
VPLLWPSGHAHVRHDHGSHQAAPHRLVPSFLSDWPGKNWISSLEHCRRLGVAYNTVWLLNNKILWAMTEREKAYVLRGKIQMDDAYLGGERLGRKAGQGSLNKVPIVAAISLNEADHPIHSKVTPVTRFSSVAIAQWASPAVGSIEPRTVLPSHTSWS